MQLAEALRAMERTDNRGVPVPFSINWVTLDRTRRTGGKVRRLDKAVRCGARHHLGRNRQIAVKPVKGGHPIPIHLRLILRVNNEPVY